MTGASERIRRVVCDVVAHALASSGADAVLVFADTTPEGRLAVDWLVQWLGPVRLWRMSELASNVHEGEAAERAGALHVHPANKTALLLGGRLPAADVLPFGDLYASQMAALAGGWTGPTSLEDMASRAGGIDAIDDALRSLIEGREDREVATQRLPGDVATALLAYYDTGRWFRTRARLVPKLGARTIGIDLFD